LARCFPSIGHLFQSIYRGEYRAKRPAAALCPHSFYVLPMHIAPVRFVPAHEKRALFMGESLSEAAPRLWTLMVYLAGDNNLERFGHTDLAELKAVGSSDRVAAVVQFDRMSDQVTRRYYLTAGQDLDADCVSALPETNTGDPKALLDFCTWRARPIPPSATRFGRPPPRHGQDARRRRGLGHPGALYASDRGRALADEGAPLPALPAAE
jgi:hypothetical protein